MNQEHHSLRIRSWASVAIVMLTGFAGCDRSDTARPTPSASGALAASAPTPSPATVDAGVGPNGGVLTSSDKGKVEVKLEKTGEIGIWMYDGEGKIHHAKGHGMSLRPVAAGSVETKLEIDDKTDGFRGKLDPVPAPGTEALLIISEPSGPPHNLRIKLP